MKKLRFSLALVAAASVLLVVAGAASAATPGSISGTVTDSLTHAPLSQMTVCAYTATTHEEEGCANTNANGEYVLAELEAGSYKVDFLGGPSFSETGEDYNNYTEQWYNNQSSYAAANPVTVNEGQVTSGINAALQGFGRISGTVVDAGNGWPINGIEVCVEPATETSYYGYYDCTKTTASGQYETHGLSAGSYKLQFSAPEKYNEALEVWELEGPNYVTQYSGAQARPETAVAVAVSNGTVTGGVNAAMQAAATITGTVTDAVSNVALQGVEVCAWGATSYECGRTSTLGTYSISRIPAGAYKVEFAPERLFNRANYKEGKPVWQRSEFPLADYAVQYWNEKDSFEAAESVTATGAVVTPGINARLVKQVQPPPPPPAPGLGIVGAKAKVKAGKAMLSVKCKGAGACKGKIKLAAKVVTVTKGKNGKAKKHSHVAVIGQGSFSVPAHKAKLVPVKLNGAGKLLVSQAGAKGLKAKVSGQGVKSGSVTLKGKAKPQPKKKSVKPKKTHKG